MITVEHAAHAPVKITTNGYAQITIDPNNIKVRHDGKVETFATEAAKAVVSVVMAK